MLGDLLIYQSYDFTILLRLAPPAFRDTLMIFPIRVHLGDHGPRRGALRSGITNHAGGVTKDPWRYESP
jgi:hypothetical protein